MEDIVEQLRKKWWRWSDRPYRTVELNAADEIEQLRRNVESVENDCMTLALRLIGEDPDMFAPETREVMDRLRPKLMAKLLGESGHPLAEVHRNRATFDAAADEYERDYWAEQAKRKADADTARGAPQQVDYYVRTVIGAMQSHNRHKMIDTQPGSPHFDGAASWNAACDETEKSQQQELSDFLMKAAEETVKSGRAYVLISPEECKAIVHRLVECDELSDLLHVIGDFAHDRSTGPAVPDDLWEVRRMAYRNLA